MVRHITHRLPWLAMLLVLAACAPVRPTAPLVLGGRSMGSTWTVKLVPPPRHTVASLRIGIQAALDRVDAQMSTWKPDSDLSRFNRAPAGTWQTLPAPFFEVLQRALQLARDSDGAYDPTVGPLVELWGFGPDRRPHRPPAVAAIEAARGHVGWWRIRLDPAQRRALQPGGVHVDLSSIAKGFGVDEVARWLDAQGVADYLVEVGGELRARGHKHDGAPWRVAIERPGVASARVASMDAVERVLELHDQAIATSGDYRHYFEDGGKAYSHHIDPRSGWPVPYLTASVTVVAERCVEADPLGTLLSVLGPDEGMEYARRHDLAVLMLVHGEHGLEELRSPAFEALLAR